MTNAVSPQLEVHGGYQNDKGLFDYESIVNAMQTRPSEISNALIWAMGTYYYPEDFAISKLTEGVGNVDYVDSFEYQYPIMKGDMDPMDSVVTATTTTKNPAISAISATTIPAAAVLSAAATILSAAAADAAAQSHVL